MANQKHSSQTKPCLFSFTDREERMMARAKVLSKIFMESYGKGREPYTIDYSHYENCGKTEVTE